MPIVSLPLRHFLLAGVLVFTVVPIAPAGAGRAVASQRPAAGQESSEAVQPPPCRLALRRLDRAGVGLAEDNSWAEVPPAWARRARSQRVAVGVVDSGCRRQDTLRRQYRGWREEDGLERNYHWFFPLGQAQAVAVDERRVDDAALPARTAVAAQVQWIVSSPAKQALRN